MQHLQNFNYLCLYSLVSCGVAYFMRLNPEWFYPMVLLRLGVMFYCYRVLYIEFDEKTKAILIAVANLVGLLLGYWDYLEVLNHFDGAKLISNICFIGLLSFTAFFFLKEIKKSME